MKTTKRTTLIVLALLLTVCLVLPFAGCQPKSDYTIGVLQLVKHNALDAATKGFVDAISEAMTKAGKTVTFDVQNAQGDSTTCSTIANSFVSKNVDLIMANATAALQASANATLTIPILGTSVTEYGVALGLTDFNGTVGNNISGTSDLAPLTEQADMIVELVPSAKKIGILYCSSEPNSKYQADVVKAHLEGLGKGLTCKVATFSDSNDLRTVAEQLASESDVIYVPTDNAVASNAPIVNDVCSAKNVPVFAGEEGICKGCGFATLSISYYNIGRKTGEMAADILLNGKDISTMPIAYDETPVAKFVKSRCEALGITVPSSYVELQIETETEA